MSTETEKAWGLIKDEIEKFRLENNIDPIKWYLDEKSGRAFLMGPNLHTILREYEDSPQYLFEKLIEQKDKDEK